jgi:hypothetical protein
MSNTDGGFWRLRHDDLAALLTRRDLSWAAVRVYLALADLTRGYGRERDEVSLSQIAEKAGMFSHGPDGKQYPNCAHVARALKVLARLGLYGSAGGNGQAMVRWVVWPPPEYRPAAGTAEQGTTAKAGSSATALGGSSGTVLDGSGTTAKTTALGGSGTTAPQGRHQEDVRHQEAQEEREKAADAATTDSHSLPVSQDAQQPTATETATETATADARENQRPTATTPADIERILRYAFPSAKPNEKAEAACRDRIGEAVRLGATPQLLAWAVQSRKAKGLTPWDRIQEAGELAADLLSRARRCWPACSNLQTVDELLAIVPIGCPARNDRERELLPVIQDWREQATTWPPDGRQTRQDGPGDARAKGTAS